MLALGKIPASSSISVKEAVDAQNNIGGTAETDSGRVRQTRGRQEAQSSRKARCRLAPRHSHDVQRGYAGNDPDRQIFVTGQPRPDRSRSAAGGYSGA